MQLRKPSGPRVGYIRDLERRVLELEAREKSSTGSENHDSNDGSLHSMSSELQNLKLPASTSPSVMNSVPESTTENFLPPPEVISELEDEYFRVFNPLFPILHAARYRAELDLPSVAQPPMYFRWGIWMLGALTLSAYAEQREAIYLRCRKCLEESEVMESQQSLWTLKGVQTWAMVATYEFSMMHYTRAWMSGGRASRLSSMLGLNKVDAKHTKFKSGMALPRDAIEAEERRRTFWAVYLGDRFSAVGTSFTGMLNDEDIMTNLPCSDEDWESGLCGRSCSLAEGMMGQPLMMSSFALRAINGAIWGKYMAHLYRERDEDLFNYDGAWWMRHRTLDGLLRKFELRFPLEGAVRVAHMDLARGCFWA